ncbi:hypothetical protein JOF41_007367 [Saccharothrix coeruleofusca]|uniref:hypothetical protein n=1 Tax=Saccharothrix coeruleofusca TaxID=33919 RepID=UPI001AE23A79|nr:hypothetical protein [Saccharothrix coeruleofusca]MBP2341113.1 hypothetical protein [Saccharothrix coeruleofusca]
MARRRAATVEDDPYTPVIRHYREALAQPAPPPEVFRWQPVAIGPTWQRTDDGHWLLPEATLGWAVLGWSGVWLQLRRGVPWRCTLEQARFILWWFALDEAGQFVYRDGVLQRLKGHGKDPLGALLAAAEAVGPCRFLEWGRDGEPVATDCPDAWVQCAAVSLEQTKNTFRLFPGMFTAEAREEYDLQIGKEQVHAYGGERLIQAVTSSPTTLEGARSSFVLLNETQHWNASNQGHEMAEVIERNTTKSADGAARTLRITNAYEPSEDSQAQRDREAWEAAQAGTAVDTGLLYDSLEAAPDAPLAPDAIARALGLPDGQEPSEAQVVEVIGEVVRSVRGDSVWLKPQRIVKSILDRRNPPSRSRRFWFNQITAAEDAWVDPRDWDLCEATGRALPLMPGDELVLFLDCSKSEDATALVGCRLDDGLLVTFGMWQRPPGRRGEGWTAPRLVVEQRVAAVFEDYRVVAFFADPSHTRDDETAERYWDDTIDRFHRRYAAQLRVWAVPGKAGTGHAVMWDMTSPARVQEFTAAAERTVEEIEEHTLLHDGDKRMRQHVRNARRYPNRYGVSLWKGAKESPRKVDLAVCAVGARMLRRLVLNRTDQLEPVDAGTIWGR